MRQLLEPKLKVILSPSRLCRWKVKLVPFHTSTEENIQERGIRK